MWDGHLECQKNPDRLKRSIHVDRIGVHSTFVYINAVLRVLMIWTNCFFLLTCLFFLEVEDNQQITVSHFGEHERPHLESSKQNYYIYVFTSNNKSHLHFTAMSAPPFFQSAGRGDLLFRRENEGPMVVILESLSEQEKKSWLEEAGRMHDWVVWFRSKKGAEKICSFEHSGKAIFFNYD